MSAMACCQIYHSIRILTVLDGNRVGGSFQMNFIRLCHYLCSKKHLLPPLIKCPDKSGFREKVRVVAVENENSVKVKLQKLT